MRRTLTVALMLACICSIALAGDDYKTSATPTKTPAAAEMKMNAMPMNNVMMMTADGKRMAMCGCGKEFEVTDKSMVMKGSPAMYCCSPECHEHAMKMSKEEMEKGMAEWSTKFMAVEMPSNMKMAGEKKMATCGCGTEFEVTDKSPMIWENGVKMYCCTDKCHEMMLGMSEADRMSAEMKLLKPMVKETKEASKN